MKLLLSLYFFILAIIQMGLFFGIYHYYRTQKLIKPSLFWMNSLLVSVFAMLIFGGGILTVTDIAKPEFNFTIANTLFYVAGVLQLFFCRSLNGIVSRVSKIAFSISIALFLVIFELMRMYGTFEIRTVFMAGLACIFYIWQIFELREKRKHAPSVQLQYLQHVTFAEAFFAAGRLTIMILSAFTIRQVEQIPQVLILFTIAQLVINTLSYIAIGAYWAERVGVSNTRAELENERIRQLLGEREDLIASLLRANKTAATGALSASIAHELNQPLGASNLNIQFLQKKLSEGALNSALEKEILDTLLADNQRAANTIKSLRSIFVESKPDAERADMNDLLDSILQIAKPEIYSQNIQIALKTAPDSFLNVNRGELQQVILNLMINAIQALSRSSRQDKKITIETRNVAEGFELSIADNGTGVSPEVRSHLFELLSANKGAGMGLGLWLCQHIATRHGGRIHYEDAAGGGAKFIVFLPSDPI